MGRPLYTNNAASALAFGINNTQTTIQLQDGMGSLFPSPSGGDYFYITVTSISVGSSYEIMQCTARSGDILTVVRGAEGTNPQYFNLGDNVQLRITAAGMNFLTGNVVTSTQVQEFTATQGQTVFTLTNFDYAPGTNNLAVFVNGSKQVSGVNFTETNVNTITFSTGLNVGDSVEAIVGLVASGGIINAGSISYTPSANSLIPVDGTVATALNDLSDKANGTNYVGYNQGGTSATNRVLTSKLQESVSVKDFGAIGDGTTDDTAAIQAAHNASRYVLYPAGNYKITSSIVLPSGAFVIGQGANSGGALTNNNTIITATTSAFAFTMDAPVGDTIEGPRFSNIQINCQNGIRLNSTTGGQPGNAGCTQGIINNPSFRKVFINNNGTYGTGTGLQASVAFHLEFTEQSEVLGFANNVDIYYSDFVLISHCRIWQFGNSAIRLTAANTFGSHAIIEKNDLLAGITGATAFIICNDLNPTLRNNYIEQVPGEGTGLTAAITCDNNLEFTIENNNISIPTACAPNWLKVTNTGSLSRVFIVNNELVGYPTPAANTALFNGGLGLSPFYSGGNGRTVCIHFGNSSEAGIPFNTITMADNVPTSYKQLAQLTPSVYGAIENYYGLPGYVKNNQFVLTPTSGGNTVFWSCPTNNFAGVAVDIYALAYADGAQTVYMHSCDNHGNINAITPTLTTKPTWYQIDSNVTATTALEVNFVSLTSGGTNNAYIMAVVINAH